MFFQKKTLTKNFWGNLSFSLYYHSSEHFLHVAIFDSEFDWYEDLYATHQLKEITVEEI